MNVHKLCNNHFWDYSVYSHRIYNYSLYMDPNLQLKHPQIQLIKNWIYS